MAQKFKHIPTIGVGIFLLLYIYSSTLYLGGSIINSESVGYDWFHNYWCDLMYVHCLNGKINIARPYAVTGWLILCLSVLIILLSLIHKIYQSSNRKTILQCCAILAMGFGMMASTDNHDLYVVLSFPFGAVTVLSLAISTQSTQSNFLKWVGCLVVISLTLSFIMYFSSLGLYWIGFIQKIALALSFIWIISYYYYHMD